MAVMSSASVTVRYDGPALAGHQMDVADLAPALLGISDLCKHANRRFNGDRAAIQILIGADQDHKCFQVTLEIVQTIWQQAQALIQNSDVKNAKEILEWLGIIETGLGGVGLFRLLKKVGKGKITSAKLEVMDGRDYYRVEINGDNNNVIVVHPESFQLFKEPAVIESAKRVVQPLMKEGYANIDFESGKTVEKITKDEARRIAEIETSDNQDEIIAGEPQTFSAYIKVYAPVYDLKVTIWRFQYGNGHEYMDISETDIAEKAMARGGAFIDDTYKVQLEMTQTKTAGGQFRNKYKIKKVEEFHPAKIVTQGSLLKRRFFAP